MTGRRIALIVLLIVFGLGIIVAVVWFLRSRDVDGGIPSLLPSRSASVRNAGDPEGDNPKYQAAADGPIAPAWHEGEAVTVSSPSPTPYQPPYTNPADASFAP